MSVKRIACCGNAEDNVYPSSINESLFKEKSPLSSIWNSDLQGLNYSDLDHTKLPTSLQYPRSRYCNQFNRSNAPSEKFSAGELEARVSKVDDPYTLKQKLFECNKERVDTCRKLYTFVEEGNSEIVRVKNEDSKLITMLESQLLQEKEERKKLQTKFAESQKEVSSLLMKLGECQKKANEAASDIPLHDWTAVFKNKNVTTNDRLDCHLERKTEEMELLSERIIQQKNVIEQLKSEIEKLRSEAHTSKASSLEKEAYVQRLEAVTKGTIIDQSGAGMVASLQQERRRLETKVDNLQDEVRVLKFKMNEDAIKCKIMGTVKDEGGKVSELSVGEHQKEIQELKEKNAILNKRIAELQTALLNKEQVLMSLQMSFDKTKIKASVQNAELVALKERKCPIMAIKDTNISNEKQKALNKDYIVDQMLQALKKKQLLKVEFIKIAQDTYKYGTQIVDLKPTQNEQTLTVQFGIRQSLPVEEYIAKFENEELRKASNQKREELHQDYKPQWTSVFQSHWNESSLQPPTYAMEKATIALPPLCTSSHNFGAQEAVWPMS